MQRVHRALGELVQISELEMRLSRQKCQLYDQIQAALDDVGSSRNARSILRSLARSFGGVWRHS